MQRDKIYNALKYFDVIEVYVDTTSRPSIDCYYDGSSRYIESCDFTIKFPESSSKKIYQSAMLHEFLVTCQKNIHLAKMWDDFITMAELHGIPRPNLE